MLSLIPLAPLAAAALPPVDPPVPTGASAPDEAALVVGLEDYFVLPDVPHARRDADAFEAFLRQTRGVPADRVRRLDQASREQILAALDDLQGAALVWVYFAGHGAASPSTGERILLGADVQPDLATFEARAVSVSELRARIGGRAVLVLDTCYNGFGRAGAALLDGKRFAVPVWADDPVADTLEWTAAGPDEWSGVLPGAEHGAFTWAVLGALRGWADADADGAVTVGEAQAYVSRALPALGVTDQHPQLRGAGDLVLSTATEPAPTLEPVRDVPRPAEAPAPAAGTRLGVVVGTGDPRVLEQNLARELARRVEKGWDVEAVRFEAKGTGFGIGASAGLQAWVSCGGEVHEVLLPPTGGTGTWSYHARRLAKRVEREVSCRR